MAQIPNVLLILGRIKVTFPWLDPSPNCFGAGLSASLPPCLQPSTFGPQVGRSPSLLLSLPRSNQFPVPLSLTRRRLSIRASTMSLLRRALDPSELRLTRFLPRGLDIPGSTLGSQAIPCLTLGPWNYPVITAINWPPNKGPP